MSTLHTKCPGGICPAFDLRLLRRSYVGGRMPEKSVFGKRKLGLVWAKSGRLGFGLEIAAYKHCDASIIHEHTLSYMLPR